MLKWVVERIEGTAAAVETPIGYVARAGSLDLDRACDSDRGRRGRLAVDLDEWRAECR